MKSLIALALFVSSSAFALSPPRPNAFKSTEVFACRSGNESLSIQLLGYLDFYPDSFAAGTFIDYQKNGVSVYSSAEFSQPKFIAAGGGSLDAFGKNQETGMFLSFGYDSEFVYADLEKRHFSRNAPDYRVFRMTNCSFTPALNQFTNIGLPIAKPAPAPIQKPAPPKTPYKKI